MNKNVTALILIVLAIGMYVTFTQAKIAEVREIHAVNQEYDIAIKNADALRDTRDKILKKYNNIEQKDREALDKIIPNTVDNIRLIIDLKDIADGNNLALRNIKATASPTAQKSIAPVAPPTTKANAKNLLPTPTLDTVSVSFNVTAPYQQFISFMRDLESSLRIMDLTHLTVSVNSSGVYEFGVELKTYWLRQQ